MAEGVREWWSFGLVGAVVLAAATGLAVTRVQTMAPSPGSAASGAAALASPAPSRTVPTSSQPIAASTPPPATITTAAAPARSGAGRPVYVVYQGQTLSELAQRFGTSVQTLVELNRITDPDLIYPGQRIRVS